MTQPAEPTSAPGAPQPAPQPAPTPPAPQPQPTSPPSGPDPNEPVDVDSLPANVQHLIRQLRSDAARNRTDPKAAADQARKEVAQQIGKALGLVDGDEPPDPAQLTEQIEAAQTAAYRAGVEVQLYRVAGRLGGDVEAMLDSNRFMDDFIDALDENDGAGDMDPRSREFAAAVEAAAAKALEKNPRLKTAATGPAGTPAPRPDPSQGSRGPAPQRFTGDLTAAVREHYASRQR